VTHNKDEAFALSDRIGIMRDAKLAAIGTAGALYGEPETAFVASFFAGRQLLNVEVLESAETGAQARVRFVGAEYSVRSGGAVVGGASAKLAVASQSVRLMYEATAFTVDAVVDDVVYMGHTTQIHCATVAGGQRVVADVRSEEAGAYRIGSAVRVELDPDGAILLGPEQR